MSERVDGRPVRLLLLAGRPGAMGLELIGVEGARRTIPPPDADVAWLSTSLEGRALATTRDGRVFISSPLGEVGGPDWHPISTGNLDLSALAGPLAFGALASDGSRAAFIAADFASGGPFDVVVLPIPPAAADPTVTRIGRPPEGAPPTWFGARIVVLARTPADRVGAVIVEPGGGLTDGPTPLGPSAAPGTTDWVDSIAALSISADGGHLAVGSGPDGRIEIRPAAAWLATSATTPTAVELEPEPDGSRAVAWLAMAPDGERLAIVRTNDDGESVAVTLHERTNGWRQGRRIDLPAGADRAVVAWLP